ncbi:hypothetical protein [Brucella anthropi]|uniref:hypothetical protein n=1 Tax=Brucella anthropi TaxID=529 RepID=UPI00384B2EA3
MASEDAKKAAQKHVDARLAPMMRALKIVRETNDKGRQALKAWADSKTRPAPAVTDPVLEMAQRILDMRDGKAPPLFPRVEGPHSVTIRYGVWEDDLFALATAALQNSTRPAPAATVTGLVTVGFQCSSNAVEWCETLIPKVREQHGYKIREVVTRSQAEELLAAERAEKEMLRGLLTSATYDLARANDECGALTIDNAAKDARIKAFVEYEQEAEGVKELYLGQIEALEAKLAAAEKVREAAIELDEAISDDFNIFGAQQKLRAALGGKP